MVKFSIIIPVYNVEKYLANCLDSLLNQKYDNYEIIVVNDGSTDNSQSIIDEYVKKSNKIKAFKRKNYGVSATRNFGIERATGDYLVFVDSDDSVNELLLSELDKCISKNHSEVIKYGIKKIDKEESIDVLDIENNLNGENAFMKLIKSDFFVTVWSYAYSMDFWKENGFKFGEERVHEDFGLIPFLVLKTNKLSIIDYVGYNYYVRENSIMTNNSLEKMKIKNEDSLYFFDEHIKKIEGIKISDIVKKYYKSYVANALIDRCVLLDGDMLKEYINELKKRHVGDCLLNDSIGRKIKKMLFKLTPSLYIKFFVK